MRIPDEFVDGSGVNHDKDLVKNIGGRVSDDPLIQALIQKLPSAGPWPADERVTWLKMLAMAFQVTYGKELNIHVKKEEANMFK